MRKQILGDFWILWKRCLYDLKERGMSNEFSKLVFEKMNERTDRVIDMNDILLSSLYVDPRHNYSGKRFMSNELKCRAEVFL